MHIGYINIYYLYEHYENEQKKILCVYVINEYEYYIENQRIRTQGMRKSVLIVREHHSQLIDRDIQKKMIKSMNIFEAERENITKQPKKYIPIYTKKKSSLLYMKYTILLLYFLLLSCEYTNTWI